MKLFALMFSSNHGRYYICVHQCQLYLSEMIWKHLQCYFFSLVSHCHYSYYSSKHSANWNMMPNLSFQIQLKDQQKRNTRKKKNQERFREMGTQMPPHIQNGATFPCSGEDGTQGRIHARHTRYNWDTSTRLAPAFAQASLRSLTVGKGRCGKPYVAL